MNITARGLPGRGQSLVEFALIVPVFLLIVMGVFDFGRAIVAYNQVSNAARAATRTGIVNQATDPAFTPAIYQFQVTAARQATSIVIRPATDVTYSFLGSTCGLAEKVGDCSLKVTVSYQFEAITPIIGRILGPITLSGTSELPIERSCPPVFSGETACPLPYGG